MIGWANDCVPPLVFSSVTFDDSNHENRLIVSVTRDGRHILVVVVVVVLSICKVPY